MPVEVATKRMAGKAWDLGGERSPSDFLFPVANETGQGRRLGPSMESSRRPRSLSYALPSNDLPGKTAGS